MIKKIVFALFSLLCIGGIIFSSYKIISWKKDVDSNKTIQHKLKKKIVIVEDEYKIDFKSLKESNPDTIAYIKVNNTNIDYIVVKGNDNEYYLKHNFEKKWNVAGWIFADYRNKFDGNDKNIIIYGHNTKDGSMFETLRNVLNSDWYRNEENYKVTLVTESGVYYYKVFSTYSIENEDYYITTSFNNDEEFNEFVKKIKSRSNYNYNVAVSGTDNILTLSSCLGDGKKRVVLHAKLIIE